MPEFIDIYYACQSARQNLDIYLPEGYPGPRPVILFLHPGGFTRGSKEMVKSYLPPMLKRGYAVVSANYRLADEAIFPAQIFDVKAALRWLRANAAVYQLDAKNIFTWGISAGGLFAALSGVTLDNMQLEDLSMGYQNESSRVNAVVTFITPFDVTSMERQLIELGKKPIHDNDNSGESLLIGGRISDYPDRCRTVSPMTYISKESVPFYLHFGTGDEIVPYLQSVKFADKLASVIGKDKVAINRLEGVNHFDAAHASPENINKAIDFLDRYLIA